ncbi:galactose mutarotase-like domain-containing protein [Dipodascopsis tothii]|uniref:galactose mutarotase-like domain-containing protein n=1 Tax=Dipodascopsis tothii TaxID=44089 RepID=UPI0034CEDEBE
MAIEQTDTTVTISLDSDPSTSVTVLLHGANVLSWKVGGVEKLWLSEKAILDSSKAVRGGIPLVFPVFGKATEGPTAALPQHGFARLSPWEFLGKTESSPLTVQFGLGPESVPAALASAWPYDFTLVYTIALSETSLKTSMSVENTSTTAWDFQVLFHTYFRIPDVSTVAVTGLADTVVKDKVSKSEYTAAAADVTIAAEVDRVYENVAAPVTITSAGKPFFALERTNVDDVVVWNPWTKASTNMGDFAPAEGYQTMICVEAGSVSKWNALQPGSIWEASQTMTAL